MAFDKEEVLYLADTAPIIRRYDSPSDGDDDAALDREDDAEREQRSGPNSCALGRCDRISATITAGSGRSRTAWTVHVLDDASPRWKPLYDVAASRWTAKATSCLSKGQQQGEKDDSERHDSTWPVCSYGYEAKQPATRAMLTRRGGSSREDNLTSPTR